MSYPYHVIHVHSWTIIQDDDSAFFSLIIISNRLGPGWGGDDYKSITSSNPGTHSPAPATRPARDAISLNNVEVTLRK